MESNDGIEQAQGNILSYLDMLTTSISAVRVKMSPAPEEQEKFERFCIDLWERVLGDEPLGFYHCRVADAYSRLSADLPLQKKASECLGALEKMADHAIAFDHRDDGVYTQPWLDGKTYSCKYFSKNYFSNESFLRLKSLDNIYSFLRENACLTALVDRLQRAAHEVG